MNFIVDRTITDEIRSNLNKYGAIYESTIIPTDDMAISTHPDLQIHFLEKDIAICPPETFDYYFDILPGNIKIIQGGEIGSKYPYVSSYNVVRIEDYVICNTKYTDKNIMDYYTRKNKKIFHVNQGYTKCNVCPIRKNVFITEDRGIYNTFLNSKEIKAILLNHGDIILNGFDYGFIGGATGIIENKILLCGSLKKYNQGHILKKIAEEYNIKIIELSSSKVTDYGSILCF